MISLHLNEVENNEEEKIAMYLLLNGWENDKRTGYGWWNKAGIGWLSRGSAYSYQLGKDEDDHR
jgi:hypothetical protein